MTFVDLEDVSEFIITPELLNKTTQQLRSYGQKGMEARVLWAGQPYTQNGIRITDSILPEQKVTPTETVVEHPEILRICRELYDLDKILVAQIHTHPKGAFHSKIDDDQPITTQFGSLSIVVPNYARDPPNGLDHWAIYRLDPDGWRGPITSADLIEIDRRDKP